MIPNASLIGFCSQEIAFNFGASIGARGNCRNFMIPGGTASCRRSIPDWHYIDVLIPEGFVDSSWHNDSSPSWYEEKLNVKLWIEAADPELRDTHGPRFALQQYDDNFEYVRDIVMTDDYDEVLRAVETIRSV